MLNWAFHVVIFLSISEVIRTQENCQELSDCRFYTCLSRRLGCSRNDYLLAYGYQYCLRSDTNRLLFNSQVRRSAVQLAIAICWLLIHLAIPHWMLSPTTLHGPPRWILYACMGINLAHNICKHNIWLKYCMHLSWLFQLVLNSFQSTQLDFDRLRRWMQLLLLCATILNVRLNGF